MRNATHHTKRASAPKPGRCAKCGQSAPFTAGNGERLCGPHFDETFAN